MPTDMMNRILMPDSTVLEVHDVGRGQANGVATLDANKKVVQNFPIVYGTQVNAPSPYSDRYNLSEYITLRLRGAI